MHDHNLRVRESRSLPFFWISRVLLAKYKLTWKGILAYTALAYYAHSSNSTVKGIGIRTMAQLVGIGETAMKEGLAELVTKKAVIKRERKTKSKKTGKHLSLPNEYILTDLIDPDEGKQPF